MSNILIITLTVVVGVIAIILLCAGLDYLQTGGKFRREKEVDKMYDMTARYNYYNAQIEHKRKRK